MVKNISENLIEKIECTKQHTCFFFYELLWAIYFEIRPMKKYFKKKFKVANIYVSQVN